VKNFSRNALSNQRAYFWQYSGGPDSGTTYLYWNDHTSRKIMEYGLAANSPRAARAYALQSIAFYDAYVATFDGKYAYWAIRPFS
jgi:hypothetical protein